MGEEVPCITVLIAARPEQAAIKALDAALRLDYPRDKLQILVARGRQPSAQRNAGLRAAKGSLVYFLDDDSIPVHDNLRLALRHFEDATVQMVGGPNLCPSGAPWIEHVFAIVLSSRLAFGPSRARYAPVGSVRATSEKELILCNLAARRDALLDLGGFNEALYPNEENALMDQLQSRGGKLLYDPAFIVERRPRSSLRAFSKMLITYGRGRAEQFRVHPTMGSVLNFVPPAFLAYLLLLPLVIVFAGWISLLPLVLYLVAVLSDLVLGTLRFGARAVAAAPLIVLTHVLYGFGFWRGLFTPLSAPSGRVGGAPGVRLEEQVLSPART